VCLIVAVKIVLANITIIIIVRNMGDFKIFRNRSGAKPLYSFSSISINFKLKSSIFSVP